MEQHSVPWKVPLYKFDLVKLRPDSTGPTIRGELEFYSSVLRKGGLLSRHYDGTIRGSVSSSCLGS